MSKEGLESIHKLQPKDIPVDKSEDLALEPLINAIRIEHSNNITKHKAEEMKALEAGQKKVQFLMNLRNVLIKGGKEDGTFEMNDELKKVLEETQKPGNEELLEVMRSIGVLSNTATYDKGSFAELFKKLEDNKDLKAKVEALGIKAGDKPKDEQLNKLVELANSEGDLKKMLNELNITGSKKKYSKVEKDNAIDSIRTYIDQYNQLTEMTFQKLTRYEADLDKAYTALMTCLKTIKEVKQRMTSGMAPR